MARNRGPSKRRGPNVMQIITIVIAALVILSMVLSVLPIGQP